MGASLAAGLQAAKSAAQRTVPRRPTCALIILLAVVRLYWAAFSCESSRGGGCAVEGNCIRAGSQPEARLHMSRNSSDIFKLEVPGISIFRRQRRGGVHHIFVGYRHGHADAAINSRDMLKHIVEIRDPQGS